MASTPFMNRSGAGTMVVSRPLVTITKRIDTQPDDRAKIQPVLSFGNQELR